MFNEKKSMFEFCNEVHWDDKTANEELLFDDPLTSKGRKFFYYWENDF